MRNREANEAHTIGAVMFGLPDRVARMRGVANGVRVTATLRPAAKHIHISTGLALTRPSGRKASKMMKRPRPMEAPAKNSGKMNPPCHPGGAVFGNNCHG